MLRGFRGLAASIHIFEYPHIKNINLISLFYRQSDGKTNRQIEGTTDRDLHAEIHTVLQTDK